MKSTTLFTKINQAFVANLTPEVKETIAFDLVNPKHKIFTAAELWNVQRQRKSRIQRKYL